MFGLEGKVALVTGAGRGIGEAVAIAYAKLGCDVALSSRTVSELEEVADKVRKLGRRAIVLPADMGDIPKMPDLVHQTVKALGRIDILVNNAGIALIDKLEVAKLEDFDRSFDVNLKSVLVLCQTAVPYMKKQGAGKIITVSSMTAVRPIPPSGVYGMTKNSVKMFTRTLAAELAWEKANIQVNCVGPGAFATSQWNRVVTENPGFEEHQVAQIPMQRVGTTDEIVGAFIFLASRASDYVTGISIYPDGGWLTT